MFTKRATRIMLPPIWSFLLSLSSTFLMCSPYQDLSGMNFKLTPQFLDPLMCDFQWTRRMWCTCERRHQLKKAPHSQGSHTIISFRPTQTLTKSMNQTKPSGEGRKKGKSVYVYVWNVSGTVELWDRAVTNKTRQSAKGSLRRQTSIRHGDTFTSSTSVAFSWILDSLFLLIGCSSRWSCSHYFVGTRFAGKYFQRECSLNHTTCT